MIGSSCQILPLPEKLTETVSVSTKNDDLNKKRIFKGIYSFKYLQSTKEDFCKAWLLVPVLMTTGRDNGSGQGWSFSSIKCKKWKLVADKMLWKYNVHFGWYPSNFSAISSTEEGRRMEVILLKILQIKRNPVKSS